MSHTPGPWELIPQKHGESEIVANGPNRDDVACICVVAGGLGSSIEDGRDYESEANANLIAAAPEMLAMLHKLEDLPYGWDEGADPIWDELRALIVKAHGAA